MSDALGDWKPPWDAPYYNVLQPHGLDIVLAVLDMVRPRLKVEEDCIIPAHESVTNLRNWIQSQNGDRSAAESMINHMHMVDLVGGWVFPEPTDREMLVRLAEYYAALLDAEVRRVAPGRSYKVEIWGIEESRIELVALQVTAWMVRDQAIAGGG